MLPSPAVPCWSSPCCAASAPEALRRLCPPPRAHLALRSLTTSGCRKGDRPHGSRINTGTGNRHSHTSCVATIITCPARLLSRRPARLIIPRASAPPAPRKASAGSSCNRHLTGRYFCRASASPPLFLPQQCFPHPIPACQGSATISPPRDTSTHSL